MKCIRFTMLLCVCLAMGDGAYAQITIFRPDVEANFVNHTWYATSDSSTLTLDLGSESSSAQVFDFSAITIAATATIETTAYFPPGGQLRAGDFPSASACVVQTQRKSIEGGYTITRTFAYYYSSETDGAYGLGYALRQQMTPDPPPPYVADTTDVYTDLPKQLVLPLPLTVGVSRSGIDTLNDANGTQVTSLTYTADGFGTLTSPMIGSLPALRVIQDKIVWNTRNGTTIRQPAERSIVFYTKNLLQIAFDVDTTYTGGPVQLRNYRLQTQAPVTSVEESPRTMPLEIRLRQNFPNPFNPSTSINYAIPVRGAVRLEIFDILGKRIETLANGEQEGGEHTIRWSAASSGSGVYFYRLSVQINGKTYTKMNPMLLLK